MKTCTTLTSEDLAAIGPKQMRLAVDLLKIVRRAGESLLEPAAP